MKSTAPKRGETALRGRMAAVVGRVAPATALTALAVVVLGLLAIHPAQTWLNQKRQLDAAEAEMVEVQADVAELKRQLDMLSTDDEVERRARRDFYLVYPGEESYRILPEPD